MSEAVTIAGPLVAQAAASQSEATTVSASMLAQQLDCSRAYIDKLDIHVSGQGARRP